MAQRFKNEYQIKNNKFYFNELRNVVILGYLESLEVIKKINDSLKLNTFLIKSNLFQLKNIKIKNICIQLNNSFLNIENQMFNINNPLFVSFGPRWIFKKNILTSNKQILFRIFK